MNPVRIVGTECVEGSEGLGRDALGQSYVSWVLFRLQGLSHRCYSAATEESPGRQPGAMFIFVFAATPEPQPENSQADMPTSDTKHNAAEREGDSEERGKGWSDRRGQDRL